MRSINFHEAAYTPSETEAITGVTATTQRNWRRRGYLAPPPLGKHARFRASELGELMALQAFSSAGVSIARAQEAAELAALPVWHFVSRMTAEAARYRGPGATSMDEESTPRFVVIADDHAFRTNEPFHQSGALVSIVFDCAAAAQLIIDRAPIPPLTIEIDHAE